MEPEELYELLEKEEYTAIKNYLVQEELRTFATPSYLFFVGVVLLVIMYINYYVVSLLFYGSMTHFAGLSIFTAVIVLTFFFVNMFRKIIEDAETTLNNFKLNREKLLAKLEREIRRKSIWSKKGTK